MGRYFQSRWFPYFVAVGTTLIALLLRLQLQWLFENATMMPFLIAILISAWLGGLWPGLLATALGALAGDWFLLQPTGGFGLGNQGQNIQLLMYSAFGAAISVACQWLHRASRRATTLNADLGELQRMEDSLRQLAADLSEADQRKDRFLATLSHELRNPLAPIRNALELMKRATDDRATMDQARSAMERQVLQMVRLVDDLLDVSRITRDKLELRRETVSLQSVLDNALEAARPCIDEHRHHLLVTLPERPVWLNVDAARTAQVFSNLLNNAAKYTDDGGELQLSAHVDGDEAIVSVVDNGIGIPPQQMSKVLEMFNQVDDSIERAEGGLGIGLSLSKRLVEMHNGRMDLHAAPGGKGTEVEVRLLTTTPPLNLPPSTQPVLTDSAPATRRRVLVVDDNIDSAQTLAMVLDVMGHETRLANDGAEAVRLAQVFQPEVVLLDIGMPRLNGYEACRQIRAQAWAKDVRMVAVTGWGQDEDRRRSKDAGFDMHLVKPLDPVVVERLMRRLETDHEQKAPVLH